MYVNVVGEVGIAFWKEKASKRRDLGHSYLVQRAI